MSGTGRTNSGHGRLGSVLSGLAVAVGCVLFLGGFVWGAVEYQPYTVPTDSMDPTVKAGDRVLAQRISGDEVRRGDVVVFKDAQWGDMPMVTADAAGNATLEATIDGVAIGTGAGDIVGRAVIVHKDADDYATQPTGNSGARVACGVIART